MKILNIENNSLAREVGLQVGDSVVKINGNPVRDILDYRFLIADEDVELEVVRSGQKMFYEIEKEYDDQLGLGFEEIQIRHCGNDCPFCFVDQNPAGMRQSMYFRDEDFRLSFLSGHYVTLTNLSKKDMDRIVAQRLTPIFVSVHATEPEIRKFLFGIEHDDHLFEKLEFLTGNDIEIHTQIVLCPKINDGTVLKKTVWDLARFLPNLRSVSIVPVGLTKHRGGLKKLDPVTNEYAAEYLEIANNYAADFLKRTGEHFVYVADEFYIMAGQPLPAAERYDGFYQKENGVGMVRYLLDEFGKQKAGFPAKLQKPLKATFVTATLAGGFMKQTILPALEKVKNFRAQLEVVENQFYGSSIRITGLLTAQDIFRQLSKRDLGDKVYLPANCLKDNSIFLDDWTVKKLSSKLNCPVEPLDDFLTIFKNGN
ncbi:DUF512 domain-containing protein [candidate division KSB1 bacterium]|nr:DUF512 domain-containing protein [candidate division KSB1 bacterium]